MAAVNVVKNNFIANSQAVVSILKNFFQRNNPFLSVGANAQQAIYQLRTLKSHLKILKFRFMLYKMQLNSMEQHLNAGNTHQHLGQKFNKSY